METIYYIVTKCLIVKKKMTNMVKIRGEYYLIPKFFELLKIYPKQNKIGI